MRVWQRLTLGRCGSVIGIVGAAALWMSCDRLLTVGGMYGHTAGTSGAAGAAATGGRGGHSGGRGGTPEGNVGGAAGGSAAGVGGTQACDLINPGASTGGLSSWKRDVAAVSLPASTTCSRQRWCVELPRPFGAAEFPPTNAIWGTGPDAVFVLGTYDVAFWNGATWSTMDLPPFSVSGSPAHPDLAHIHGTSLNDVWAAGDRVLHFDGCRWTAIEAGTTAPITALWAIAPSDAWMADMKGTLLHWNGSGWTAVTPSPVPAGMLIRDLWAASGSDVWAVGPGALLHFDGVAWRQPVGAFGIVGNTVWGTGGDSVWVLGEGIYHWDGVAWAAQLASVVGQAGTTIRGAWGTGPTDVWAAASGTPGALLHHNGVAWDTVQLPRTGSGTVFVPRANDVWTMAGGPTHGDGARFERIGQSMSMSGYRAVERTAEPAVYALSSDALVRFDGSAWTRMTPPAGASAFTTLSVRSATDLWLAGSTATGFAIFHLGSAGWATFPVGGSDPITSLLATGSGVWLTGTKPQPPVGAPWRAVPEARAFWGASPTDVWSLTATSIGHYDGTSWRYQARPEDLIAIAGSGPNDVFASGVGGVVLHWDGTAWTPMTTGTSLTLGALTVVGRDDVWATGPDALFHWDGRAWSPRRSGFSGLAAGGSDGGGGAETWLLNKEIVFHYLGGP